MIDRLIVTLYVHTRLRAPTRVHTPAKRPSLCVEYSFPLVILLFRSVTHVSRYFPFCPFSFRLIRTDTHPLTVSPFTANTFDLFRSKEELLPATGIRPPRLTIHPRPKSTDPLHRFEPQKRRTKTNLSPIHVVIHRSRFNPLSRGPRSATYYLANDLLVWSLQFRPGPSINQPLSVLSALSKRPIDL